VTLPIGDRPANRQKGFDALRKEEKPLGFHVRGKITGEILDRIERGERSYWDHER
jgi:hypothetical protein